MRFSQTAGLVTRKEAIQILQGPLLTFTRIDNIEELIQAAEDMDELPFWAELWPSAVGLATYLWKECAISGQRVLELGAGLGLVGIVAAKKGASVLQTDFIAAALELARQNAQENDVSIERILADWRDFPAIGRFSVILGSDILYESTMHDQLEEILNVCLADGGKVILSDPGRDHAAKFLARFQPEQWDLGKASLPVELDGKTYNIRIYLLEKIKPNKED